MPDLLTITPTQMSMARAVMRWSTRDLARRIDSYAVAVSKYERTGAGLNQERVAKARELFESERVYFGPKDGVCVGIDVFESDRWLAGALWKLLNDAGVYPDSQALIRAGKEARNG